MRPVVGWFFLFFCLARASKVRSEVQATRARTATTAAACAEEPLSLGMNLDLLRGGRCQQHFFRLPAAAAAARARAEREQARPEEQDRRGLRDAGRRGRRAGPGGGVRRRVFIVGDEERDQDPAEERPPGEAALR